MMPHFSELSLKRLSTCHSFLIEIARESIKKYDYSILCGWRNEVEQNLAFDNGYSKLQWPNSKHNRVDTNDKPCSLAFDFNPYPKSFDPYPRYALIAGYIMGLAEGKGILIRWGADWDDDGIITEHSLIDWGHIELIHP